MYHHPSSFFWSLLHFHDFLFFLFVFLWFTWKIWFLIIYWIFNMEKKLKFMNKFKAHDQTKTKRKKQPKILVSSTVLDFFFLHLWFSINQNRFLPFLSFSLLPCTYVFFKVNNEHDGRENSYDDFFVVEMKVQNNRAFPWLKI